MLNKDQVQSIIQLVGSAMLLLNTLYVDYFRFEDANRKFEDVYTEIIKPEARSRNVLHYFIPGFLFLTGVALTIYRMTPQKKKSSGHGKIPKEHKIERLVQ